MLKNTSSQFFDLDIENPLCRGTLAKFEPSMHVLGDASKQGNRDLNGFGAASKAANFITELHLESTLAVAASIFAGQGTARAAASTRSRPRRARSAAPFRAEHGAARPAAQFRAGRGANGRARQSRG
jgi:hypothetical protein